MQYQPPYGNPNPNAPWVNGNPATGQQGSIIDATVLQNVQQEIVNVIAAAGLTPGSASNAQLLAALQIATNYSGVDTGTQNAMAVNLGPGFALATFSRIVVKALDTVTGPATIQVSTNGTLVGTFNLTRPDGTALNPYDIVANEIFTAQYDGAEFQVQKGLSGRTGQIVWYGAGTSLPGYVPLNGLTIGGAASSATMRANADCAQLFAFLWNNYSNAICAVSGGRGASPSQDFAANKTIQLLDAQCKTLVGVDGMGGASPTGRLTGVPVTSGAAATPGSTLGEALHMLSVAELPTHTPTGAIGGSQNLGNVVVNGGALGTPGDTLGNMENLTVNGSNFTFTGNPIGSNSPHDNTPLSLMAVPFMRL